MVTHQPQVERRTGKVRRSRTDVLLLCHTTKRFRICGLSAYTEDVGICTPLQVWEGGVAERVILGGADVGDNGSLRGVRNSGALWTRLRNNRTIDSRNGTKYWSKITKFAYPTCIWRPSLEWPVRISPTSSVWKTRVPRLSHGIDCSMFGANCFNIIPARDRYIQTDRRTDGRKRPGRITANSDDTIMHIHTQKASRY